MFYLINNIRQLGWQLSQKKNVASNLFYRLDRKFQIQKCINGQPIKKSNKKLLSTSLKFLGVCLPTGFTIGLLSIKAVQCSEKPPKLHDVSIAATDSLNEKDENLINKQEKELQFSWRYFFRLLKPHLWWLFVAIAGAIAVAYLNTQIPLLLGDIINVLALFANPNNDGTKNFVQSITGPAKKLFLCYGLQGLLTSLYISVLFNMGENLASDLKGKLFHSIIVREVAFFDRNRTGDLVNRLTLDINEFKSSFKLCISQGLKNVIQMFGCVVSMLMLSPKLTITLVSLVSGIVAVGSILGRGLRALSKMAQKQTSYLTVVAEEAVGNLRTVRAFAMEEIEEEKFKMEAARSSVLNKKLGFGIAAFQGLSNVALNGLVLSTLLVGGWLMAENEINAGVLMSFLISTQSIQKSLDRLSTLYGVSIQGMSAGARVFEHLLTDPGMPIKGGKIIPYHSLMCNVKFKDVTFSYPTRKDQVVIDNFSLDIIGGRKVAIVGPSGGGKSTIVSLLERFYDIDEGVISIDGINLKELDPSWIRGRLIGYISQEPVLFASSIKDNIKYGKPGATDEEVYAAAKQANAHEFITSFPNGYDTVLGERGLTISGGQKQRIAIARALIKNPPILILDEATSALDVESEKIVQEAIDNISKGRTVLLIAHRLSTIKDADLVAVVVDGRLVEVGKYDELKRKKGAFWNLIKLQH